MNIQLVAIYPLSHWAKVLRRNLGYCHDKKRDADYLYNLQTAMNKNVESADAIPDTPLIYQCYLSISSNAFVANKWGGETMGLTLDGTYDVINVIDGDTIKTNLNGQDVNLRLPCIDTEETSSSSPLKPVTRFAIETTQWTKNWLAARNNKIELEYETDYVITGFYDRHLTYVYAAGENYNLACVRQGYSPYFQKYGYSRGYHEAFLEAEQQAMSDNLGIWNDTSHAGDTVRPYHLLKMWWDVRARQIELGREEKRRNNQLLYLPDGLDYDNAVLAATNREERQVFGEVKRVRIAGPGTLIELSIKLRKQLSLYVYNDNPQHDRIINYLTTRHLSLDTDLPNSLLKQNFVFVKGLLQIYHGKPEIIINDLAQIKEEPF